MKINYMKVLNNTNLSNLPKTTGSVEINCFINGTPMELYNIECILGRIEKILEEIKEEMPKWHHPQDRKYR